MKFNEVDKKEEEQDLEREAMAMLSGFQKPELRTIGLFGEVDEEKASEIVVGLLLLTQQTKQEKEDKAKIEPIEFYLSTYGGSADDMFAIYDIVSMVKDKCEIKTYGVGKVMSAGVLLLACGSKGHRKIGKNCRVMIHSCNAGSMGDIHDLQNEMEEIKNQQDKYINALVAETSMTKRQLQKLLDRKINVYLSAEEAIEYGIADEII